MDFYTAMNIGAQEVRLLDGVYSTNTYIVLGSDVTKSVVGIGRPILVASDNYPPGLYMRNGVTVDGVWFGASQKATSARVLQMADDCTVKNCTFWNYYGVVAEGSHVRNSYSGNRFINCGTAGHYHSIYISNPAAPGDGAVIENNIFIGGEGYHIHLWHGAGSATIRRNFSANGFYEMSLRNSGHLAEDNVFWNHVPPTNSWGTILLADPANYSAFHNLFGPRTFGWNAWPHQINGETGKNVSGNGYIGSIYPDTTTWPGYSVNVGPYDPTGVSYPRAGGIDPTQCAVDDVPAFLGYSVAQIDAACNAIEASFQQSVAQIHVDNSIEQNFSVIVNVVSAWEAT